MSPYEEIERVLGQRQQFDNEDLKQLKYIKAIVEEALRVYPVIPNMNRYASSREDLSRPLSRCTQSGSRGCRYWWLPFPQGSACAVCCPSLTLCRHR
jgi:hypothetical protein